MADIRGKFLWFDLMTTDVEAAKAFYGEVVGWKVQIWSDAGMPYPMLMAGEAGVGGIMELPETAKQMGAPPHWIAYVGTAEVDSTAAQAKKLGGQVFHGPMDIPKVGRFAVIGDPTGGIFSAFTPVGDGGGMGDAKTGPGHFTWNELMSTDPEAAFGFYSSLFGWVKHESMDMGPVGVYQMYGAPGEEKASYGGYMKSPPEMGKSAWIHYVQVPNLDASLALTTQLGGKIMHGPIAVPGGDHVATCMDPQGAIFALHGKG